MKTSNGSKKIALAKQTLKLLGVKSNVKAGMTVAVGQVQTRYTCINCPGVSLA